MNNPSLEIELATQPIELCKLLKAVDLVSGGGEAKMVISEGYVYVNGEIETQKRKKIYHNDRVEFNDECILVICHAPVEDKPVRKVKSTAKDHHTAKQQVGNEQTISPKNSKKRAEKSDKTSKSNTPHKSDVRSKPTNENTGKRKPINF